MVLRVLGARLLFLVPVVGALPEQTCCENQFRKLLCLLKMLRKPISKHGNWSERALLGSCAPISTTPLGTKHFAKPQPITWHATFQMFLLQQCMSYMAWLFRHPSWHSPVLLILASHGARVYVLNVRVWQATGRTRRHINVRVRRSCPRSGRPWGWPWPRPWAAEGPWPGSHA